MKAAMRSMLNRFPHLKAVIKSLQGHLHHKTGVSSQYVTLKMSEVAGESARLRNSWKNSALPQRQRSLVDEQLHQYRSGAGVDVFDVFVDSIRGLPELHRGASLLEVGCSSGYYSEVIEIAGLPIRYSGCDYSEDFIRLARTKYPSITFAVEDATALNYAGSSFDIVVSGCCLLHIPEYVKALQETARVARSYAIFHRTPVVWEQPEQWYRKQAYGVDTVEIHFNEHRFLALLAEYGLELIATHTLSKEATGSQFNHGRACRTYVCRKKGA